MGLNTLTVRNPGDTILDSFFNDFNTALGGDFIGRNTAGVPEAGQNLGTNALPWGTVRANSMVIAGQTVDPSAVTVPQNRVISGKTRATSNQPAFITPNGAALSFIVDGDPTNLVMDINGTTVSVTTDVTKSSLTAAPSSQNTALVNDADAADQHDTKLWGEPEHRKSITIDTVGTNITALIGKYAAFKIAGVGTEYFLAYVKSGTELTQCRRGFFYDSSLNPINRTGFSNNDTITLMKLGWIFVENNGTTVDVSYNNPTWSFTAPNSPATGDYWYDLDNQLWKRYDGASFQIINRTFVGMFVNDTTACVAARSEDLYAKYSGESTVNVEVSTTEIVKATKTHQKVNVSGNVFEFENSQPTWNITTDLATSSDMYDATEQADRVYYAYLSDQGETIISDISPYFRNDLYGQYHPHNPWRCVGVFYNDGSSDIVQASGDGNDMFEVLETSGKGAVATAIRLWGSVLSFNGCAAVYRATANDGSYWEVVKPGRFDINIFDQANNNGSKTGISLNSSQLTTAIFGITAADVVGYDTTDSAGNSANFNASRTFKIGDIIRNHCDPAGTAFGSNTYSKLRIMRIPDQYGA